MEEAGRKINSFDDWKKVILELADKAISKDRVLNAAFYYRAAKFYTFSDDPDKEPLYDRFIDLFFKVFADDGIANIGLALKTMVEWWIMTCPRNLEQ